MVSSRIRAEEGGGKEGGAERLESGGDPMRKRREERPADGRTQRKEAEPPAFMGASWALGI